MALVQLQQHTLIKQHLHKWSKCFESSSANNASSNNISTSKSNSYGIYLYADSDANIISNSSIISNNSYAAYLYNSTTLKPENNTVYNCLLNGSVLAVNGTAGWVDITNYWNITSQSGTRRYSNGTSIGGNYYTNSTGNGFSDTCADADHNGFCDASYNVSTNSVCSGATCGNNTDYLALSDEYLASSTPIISNVTLNDSDGGAIQLSVADDMRVWCNASIYDAVGYQDVNASRAVLYHQTSSYGASDDRNDHYSNSSCTLGVGSGNYINVSCGFVLYHQALNGTWTCNISANSSAGLNGSNTTTNTVDQLVALSVLEDSISFGTLQPGANSSSAQSTNISNLGNTLIDIAVNGSAMVCNVSGTIGATNISYNLSSGNYDSMSAKKLNNTLVTETGFDLGIQGIATADSINSTKLEYWTMKVPTAVRGTCRNNITVTAVLG
jgi:hypothetical protein